MNTNAIYRTRRLYVRGGINEFIGKSGLQERNMYVPLGTVTEFTGKNHIPVGTIIRFTGKNHVSVGAIIGFGLNSQNSKFYIYVVLTDRIIKSQVD